MGSNAESEVLVSVVMPTYNSESYLMESLECLKRQTFKAFEVIVVNDGSTDKTASILQHCAQMDARVIPVHVKKTGVASARNCGLFVARGKYVIFLDSDDIFHSDLIARCYEEAEKSQADITIFRYTILNMKDGKKLQGRGFCKKKSQLSVYPLQLSLINPEAWNKFYRKDFLLKNHLEFQNLVTCNDVMFTKLSLLSAEKISYIEDDLMTYRMNDKNISSTRYRYASNIIEAGNGILSYVREKQVSFDYDDFYRMMSSFVNHEFKHFPQDADKFAFIGCSLRFFPEKYRRKVKLKMIRVIVSNLSLSTWKICFKEIAFLAKH